MLANAAAIDAMKRFGLSDAALSENPTAMAMLCTVLRDKGHFEDAFALGLAAIDAAPNDIEVRDLVAAALSNGVPKWHRPMLHDHLRNRAYARALEEAIQPGMVVLEIGSGAGLLSMLAARLGAIVYTCEANPMVAAAAKSIVHQNGLSEKVCVIPKLSTELVVGVDLPVRAQLLMSELFDDTLFGDGIVSYIRDAQERLLEPGAEVIPRHAELRLALVDLNRPSRHEPLGYVEGFDLSSFNILAPQSSAIMRTRKLDAEARSTHASALQKDFEQEAPYGSDQDLVELTSSGGTITGVAQWLRIRFSDENIFENSPFEVSASHWGSPLTIFPRTFLTQPGERISLTVRRLDRQLFYRME